MHQNFYLLRFHAIFHGLPEQKLHNYYILKIDIEELSLKFFPFRIIVLINFFFRKSPYLMKIYMQNSLTVKIEEQYLNLEEGESSRF